MGAVSSISLGDYILATLIGKFPAVDLEVIVGHDLVSYEQNMVRLTSVVIGAFVIYCGVWWWGNKVVAAREKVN